MENQNSNVRNLVTEVKKLGNDQLAEFAKEFFEKFLINGFGMLQKQEIELFVFHHLCNLVPTLRAETIYDLANTLQISERRAKILLLEDNLKYHEFNRKQSLNIFKQKIERGEIKPDITEKWLQVLIEDPVLKRDLEHAIKKSGFIVDYSFNHDILKVKIKDLLEILKDKERSFYQELSNNILKKVGLKTKDYTDALKEPNKFAEFAGVVMNQGSLLVFAELIKIIFVMITSVG